MKSLKIFKSVSRRTLISFLVLLSVLFCFSCTTFAQEETVTLNKQKYNQVLTLLQQQDSQLATLQNRISLLSLSSNEVVTLLEECQQELTVAKTSLSQAQTNLTNSQNSLKNAETEIIKLKASLSLLEQQVKNELSIRKRQQIQTGCWCFLGGVLVGVLVSR